MDKTPEATVTHEGRWWVIEVPEIDGLTQARRLAEVELMARELIAVTLDIPLTAAKVKITAKAVGGMGVSREKKPTSRT